MKTYSVTLFVVLVIFAIWYAFYQLGYDRGIRYGVSTTRLVMEQSAINNGCAEYYINNGEVRFRWMNER